MKKKRIFTTVCIAMGVVTLAACSNEPKKVRPISAAPESSTTVPTTVVIPPTTTTMPIPTTTTTIRRVVTTTTTMPEPEVQGQVEVADASGVSLSDPDMDKWRQIARCEMPGPGGTPSEPWGVHWTFIGSRFSGSMGIANVTWRAFGGTEFGPTAGHATWQQQITVARRIRDRYGYSAWGCG